MYATKREMFEVMRSQLDLDRSSFIPVWKDLANNFLPRRARFQITDNNRGDRRNTNIVDSTPTFSARTLRSGMMGGITSPARPWFRLTTPDPQMAEVGSVKQWLDTVSRRMSTVFLKSNLYQVLPVAYGDLGVFATHAMLMEEDFEKVVRFTSFPIGTYWIACDDKGRVNVFMREFRMTVRQLLSKFGERDSKGQYDWSNISLMVRSLYEAKNMEAWVDVCHVIMPNGDYQPKGGRSTEKKFSSCYYERGTYGGKSVVTTDLSDLKGKILRESGYDYFPVLCPRWEVSEGDAYGTDSPGMVALGDAKALQVMQKRGAQAVEKMINPPMVADSSLRNSKATILPGDITFVEGEDGQRKRFRPAHEVNPRMQEFLLLVEEHQKRINRAMFADLFLMTAESDRRDVTAREIEERHEEKFLILGPVLEQLNQDLLDPLIDNTFNIMVRQGLIPRAPSELAGKDLKVEYVSLMAQAQKLSALGGIERFTNFVTNLATNSEDPAVWDKVDRDQMIDEYGDIVSIAPGIVRPDDKVGEIRESRNKAQQEQANAEGMAQQAAAAKDLGSIDMNQDSALTQLMRQAQAGQIQAVN